MRRDSLCDHGYRKGLSSNTLTKQGRAFPINGKALFFYDGAVGGHITDGILFHLPLRKAVGIFLNQSGRIRGCSRWLS